MGNSDLINTINVSEDQIDARLTITCQAGEASGIESMAAHLLGKAGEAFAKEDDGRAKVLRDAARELGVFAKEARKKQREMSVSYRDEFDSDWFVPED